MKNAKELFAKERARIAAILDAAMGRGTGYPVEVVAEGSGVPAAKLYGVHREESKLYFEEGLALLGQLPVEVANAILAPYGLIAERIASNHRPCPIAAQEAALDYSHTVARALANDGRICHREMPLLIKKARDVLRRFMPVAKAAA